MPNVVCPDCGAAMKLRFGRYGHFFGCSTYPTCRGLQKANEHGDPVGIPANIETRKLRQQVLMALRDGLLERLYLSKSVGDMSREDCLDALAQVGQVNDISEVELTVWERLELEALVSEPKAEDDEGVVDVRRKLDER